MAVSANLTVTQCCAILKGLQFALLNNLAIIEVESDSKNVIDAIKHQDKLSTAFHLISDMLNFSSTLGNVGFNHILHQGNIVAHKQAISAFHSVRSFVWLYEMLDCIASSVLGDLSPWV
ncbi:Ribonuclease H-like domain containing protein [Parasponia andersonii]|uniref:Ribonuclease H-like domain containing protein n=1 Tax=Parasponia andersonii TaxID=3476 RepID=A0A2P5BEC2_PARAD|nr:Ribonuclease H-like domain containing protein [Parasponia andersonii]